MTKTFVNPETLYDATPIGMSQAVIDSESSLLFISGQVDWDKQRQVSSDSVSGQLGRALENLKTVLQEGGADVDTLLQVRLYMRGELEDHIEAVTPILAAFLKGSGAALTAIGVASLTSKATLVEVEAIARVK
jgi:2-iminobutanoate/2-iminopropanoate deaminase